MEYVWGDTVIASTKDIHLSPVISCDGTVMAIKDVNKIAVENTLVNSEYIGNGEYEFRYEGGTFSEPEEYCTGDALM